MKKKTKKGVRCGQIIGLASWEMERDREQKVGDGMWPFHNGISIVWPMEANQQKPEKCWYWVSENIIWNVLHPSNLEYCVLALFVSLKQNHSPGRLYRPLRSVQRYCWDLVRFGTAIFTQVSLSESELCWCLPWKSSPQLFPAQKPSYLISPNYWTQPRVHTFP